MEKINGPVLSSGEVLNQAHDGAIFGARVNNEGRNLCLTKLLIGLEPTLATDQVVSWSIRIMVLGNHDGSLQANLFNVCSDFLEDFLVSDSRIDHGDPIDRDHFDQ